jgi:hypothetical protein
MKRQLAELRTIYAPNYYKITRLEAQIAELEAGVQKERRTILNRLHTDYVAASELERMLSDSLARNIKTVQQQTAKERRYGVLKNEVDTTQKLYDSVLEKAKMAGAESSMRMTNVRMIDSALPPALPYSPNLRLNMAVGLAAGFVFGVGLVFVRARPSRVRQPGELNFSHFRELGVVPSAKRVKRAATTDHDPGGLAIWDSGEPSLAKESFRAALTSVLFSTRPNGGAPNPGLWETGRIFVVASLEMAEGKTTVAANLGIASAERRHDVLLIDADLRRPRLHERFRLPNNRGLADLLSGPEPAALSDQELNSFVQPNFKSVGAEQRGHGRGASGAALFTRI